MLCILLECKDKLMTLLFNFFVADMQFVFSDS